MDLATALDSVDRNMLLKKFEYYGVTGHALMFLKSYFAECLQYTNTSDSNSNVLSVKYDIVQGSTLGLLMFLVHNNDIVGTSRLLKFTLVADDTSVCLSGYDLNTLINTLNRKLKLLEKTVHSQ